MIDQDESSQVINEGKKIIELGEQLYAKHGHEKSKHEYIRQKLREMGRLVRVSRKGGKIQRMEEFF